MNRLSNNEIILDGCSIQCAFVLQFVEFRFAISKNVNFIANILGLGWAATPAGLKAMKELETLEEERRAGKAPGPVRRKGVASNEMCTFLIMNISSLQLIPMNVIAYRSQYGSANPAAIVGAGILATVASTGAAVIFCKIAEQRRKKSGIIKESRYPVKNRKSA